MVALAADHEDVLLASLEAQGQAFLKSFGSFGVKRKRSDNREGTTKLTRSLKPKAFTENKKHLDEEWTGFSSEEDINPDDYDPSKESNGRDEARMPHIVVFSEGASTSRVSSSTKSQARAFMSSKVSKLKELSVEANDNMKDNEDAEQELSNKHNDALLHRLVHTKLLSGSLNPELNMTASQRRKALAGRVHELAGHSKLGKGEGVVRQGEKRKASKRVRDGMMVKQKERDTKSLNEAKEMGNYHPALKRLFASSSSGAQSRKRDRGLKMGIGRFSGGTLKLTPEEIGSVRAIRSVRGRGKSGRGGKR